MTINALLRIIQIAKSASNFRYTEVYRRLDYCLKDSPESPLSSVPGASSFRVAPGTDSAALGTALQGCSVKGFVRSTVRLPKLAELLASNRMT